MTYRKKLIEVALPLEAINDASAREKSIRHGHPSTLHLWWARRPLAACRAVIFASLVDDPDDPDATREYVEACNKLPRGKNAAENDTPRQRLFDFIEVLVQWQSTTDDKVLETARKLIHLSTNDNPPPLADPFAGGGSIPLEAQRLGLYVHASDLNPVAVLINKAMVEIPPKYKDLPPVNPRDQKGTGINASWRGTIGLTADVRYYGEWIRKQAWDKIGHLYPPYNGHQVLVWIWSRAVMSPNPAVNTYVPLISSYWLSKKSGERIWLKPVIDVEKNKYSFTVQTGSPANMEAISKGTKAGRATFRCLISGVPITNKYIDDEANLGRMEIAPIAIISEEKDIRKYQAFNSFHKNIALKEANTYLRNIISESQIPNEPSRGTFGSNNAQGRIYGFKTFADYFTPRQLVAIATFNSLIIEVRNRIIEDVLNTEGKAVNDLHRGKDLDAEAYASAISLYLAFALDKCIDYWSTLTTWMPRGTVGHAFARQAIPMTWDFPEANPFAKFHCSWSSACEWVAKSIETLPANNSCSVAMRDATQSVDLDNQMIIFTDPPYYDNIEYSDLSDFFYVWLRRSMKHVFPAELSTILTPKDKELVANAYRFDGRRELANNHFESGLEQSFKNMHTILDANYPLTTFYAFKQTESDSSSGETGSTGWETMLEGLIRSGFTIEGTWPVRTERSVRSVAISRNALASSIILVCRPRLTSSRITSRRDFISALRNELPSALREMFTGNLAPVDLAQACIGPGMAVYSRYKKVLEPNGERLTVRAALQIINQELDAYLTEQEGHIDEDSRFAVAWFEQFGFKEGPFGQADVLARAKNTSVEGLASAGVLESGGGRVRLYHWSDLEPGWDPAKDRRLTVWEATHHLIERLNTYGEEGAAQLLAKMPSDLVAEARQLAYRLYSICERKGWAEHARDYNALVISWSASQEQAREFRDQYQQGTLF